MKNIYDIARTRRLATAIKRNNFKYTKVKEDPTGCSAEHMAWMLDRVLKDDTMDLPKMSRWIGYVQAWLVLHYHRTLEETKTTTAYFRDHD